MRGDLSTTLEAKRSDKRVLIRWWSDSIFFVKEEGRLSAAVIVGKVAGLRNIGFNQWVLPFSAHWNHLESYHNSHAGNSGKLNANMRAQNLESVLWVTSLVIIICYQGWGCCPKHGPWIRIIWESFENYLCLDPTTRKSDSIALGLGPCYQGF